MEELRNQILSKRKANFERRSFIPQLALNDVMGKIQIQKALKESSIPVHDIGEITKEILEGARNTFAILLLLRQPQSILTFVRDDQFQSSLDQKLPLPLEKAERLLPNASLGQEFYEKQWEFCVPVFSKRLFSRVLEDDIILPIVEEEAAGEGGFGVVHRMKLHPSHQKFDQGPSQMLARKEFKPSSKSKSDYELELRNLSILKLIKHPNIIELVGSFTYRDKHNLIFPHAGGGSLASLLNGDTVSPFSTKDGLLFAICNLSSALRAVHDFLSDDIKAIGCHRDLKPSNILLIGENLVLADFGLSRFKPVSESSESQFRGGIGDYIAPECEELEGNFERGIINRSSDIWSLGCILSELITYEVKGISGIQTFRQKRMFRIGNWRFFRFHCGNNTVNKNAMDWITEIGNIGSKAEQLMVSLINKMLCLDSEKRPRIQYVNGRLRFVLISELIGPIKYHLTLLSHKTKSILAFLEQQRLISWFFVIEWSEKNLSDGKLDFLSEMSDAEIFSIIDCLHSLQEATKAILQESDRPRNRAILPLKNTIDFLLSILPTKLRDLAITYLEHSMLHSDDLAFLKDLGATMENRQSDTLCNIGLLAAVKRLKILVSESSGSTDEEKMIEAKNLRHRNVLQDFYTSHLLDPESQAERNVLVEWKFYDDHYSDDEIAREMFARLKAIVNLLSSASDIATHRVLRCRGFYHDPTAYTLGLVYDFPASSRHSNNEGSDAKAEKEQKVTTLRKILQDDPRGKARPSLGDRFLLAYKLAVSILNFHKVDWLHRNISSFNIVFFCDRDSRNKCMQSPYFLGFLSSRQNKKSAFTEGSTDDARHKDFQHPVYLRDSVRFRPEFDYYSLGLVLLELGLWSSLENILASSEFTGRSPEEVLEILLVKRVPRLGQTMGDMYRDAVNTCLQGDFGSESSVDSCLKFKEQVVEVLARCKA